MMKLLIVSDEGGHISQAVEIAKRKGANVVCVDSISKGVDYLRDGNSTDFVMIDINKDIASFISSVKKEHIYTTVIACGCNADSNSAVNAIKAGATEYIPLPPDEELIGAVFSAISKDNNGLIFVSDAMQEVADLAKNVASSEANILITGRSGTGKEVMAKFIHKNSKRAKNKMVSINCAAIPENLIESELFGHEKGAFTGAISRRIGKFEEANQGTIFLDEISEMDIRLQAKFLRVIQEKELSRLGSNDSIKLNVRILASSNRDLEEEVKEGRFREDLFFRLNVININLPELKDRKGDVDLLAKEFTAKYCDMNGFPLKKLSEYSLQKIRKYNWPGNVRELENIIHKAVLLSPTDVITDISLPTARVASNSDETETDITLDMIGRTIESVERDMVYGTLDQCVGNKTKAAAILGISIRTLRNKLNSYAVR